MLVAHSFLEFTQKLESFESRGFSRLLLTARGWAEIERMRSANPQSVIGFVAMSFHDAFTDLYSMGIAPGITAAGFEPLRMDRKEHNNRIDDEIVASIRSSRFLVADFSVDRGGIYFEAGVRTRLGLARNLVGKRIRKSQYPFRQSAVQFHPLEPERLHRVAECIEK